MPSRQDTTLAWAVNSLLVIHSPGKLTPNQKLLSCTWSQNPETEGLKRSAFLHWALDSSSPYGSLATGLKYQDHPPSVMPNTRWPSVSCAATVGVVLKLMPRDLVKTPIAGPYTPRILSQYFWCTTWGFCFSSKFSSDAGADECLAGELPLGTTWLQFLFACCSGLCLCFTMLIVTSWCGAGTWTFGQFLGCLFLHF